jgi:cobalt/nickel transport system permease protein
MPVPAPELPTAIATAHTHRSAPLDCRAKLLPILITLALLAASTRIALPAAVLAFGVAASVTLRVSPALWVRRMRTPIGITFVMVLTSAFLIGSVPIWSAELGGVQIHLFREGLSNGLLLALRVIAGVQLIALLFFTTTMTEVLGALRWMHVPGTWLELVALTTRYSHALSLRARDGKMAQRVRLGYSSPRVAWRSFGALVGNVMLRSLEQAMRTHDASRVRGYQGTFHSPRLPRVERRGWIRIAGLCTLPVAAWLLAEWGTLP